MHYKKIKAKIVSISIDKDFYAPIKAVDWLTKKYEKADVKRIHIKPSDDFANEIGHFEIFKTKFENSFWKLLLNEIQNERQKYSK